MTMLTAIAFLSGLCGALAVLLAVAHRKLKVYEDPRIDVVDELLPGANCGACGLPGCRAFAEQVVAGAVRPSQCTVGGQESAERVAEYLGIEAGEVEPTVARLLCAGGTDVAVRVGDYEGYTTCRAAATVGGGFKGCTYGCLGLGDCEVACPFDAIVMSENDLPVVDPDKCTSCGDCVDACPKGLFEILPTDQHLLVQCRTHLEGEAATALCAVACNGCSRCAADAPDGLIEMEYALPVIRQEKLALQARDAVRRCPTGAIVWIEEKQFEKAPDPDEASPSPLISGG